MRFHQRVSESEGIVGRPGRWLRVDRRGGEGCEKDERSQRGHDEIPCRRDPPQWSSGGL